MADLASSMHASLEDPLGTDEVVQGTTVFDFADRLTSMGTMYYLFALTNLSIDVTTVINSSSGIREG